MITFKEYLMENSLGTYAAVKPTNIFSTILDSVAKSLDIPNIVDKNEFHSTLLYSRKSLPTLKLDSNLTYQAKIKSIEVWPNHDKKTNVLVIVLDCPELKDRHKYLMKKYNATYDYPEFKPHLTLSYDIGNFDYNKIKIGEFPETILLTNEYKEDLV